MLGKVRIGPERDNTTVPWVVSAATRQSSILSHLQPIKVKRRGCVTKLMKKSHSVNIPRLTKRRLSPNMVATSSLDFRECQGGDKRTVGTEQRSQGRNVEDPYTILYGKISKIPLKFMEIADITLMFQ